MRPKEVKKFTFCQHKTNSRRSFPYSIWHNLKQKYGFTRKRVTFPTLFPPLPPPPQQKENLTVIFCPQKLKKPLGLQITKFSLLKGHKQKGHITFFLHISSVESKYKLRGFVAERKGERNDMQDAHVIFDDFTEEFTNKPVKM